jgi:cell wall-associated NlpC family hydrolase
VLKLEEKTATSRLRAAVLREAETWLSTPYHHMARVKGAGCDCLTFLAEVYAAAGVIEPVGKIPFYRLDFMRHQDDETYLNGLLARGHEVAAPLPADVVLYKWGRVFSHGAIVVDWPRRIIHASPSHSGVIWAHGTQGRLAGHEMRFVSPFADEAA